jgi:hypothetical protein
MVNQAARRRSRPSTLLTAAALALTVSAGPRTQEAGELDQLLDRLARYLIGYESELTTVVADEHYEQQELVTRRRPETNRPSIVPAVEVRRRRTLVSDMAFFRLPGDSIWFGVRDVRTVDGKAVAANQQRLEALVKQLTPRTIDETVKKAATIVAASSQYNLGAVRTINMPTTALEVLHPSHHVQFIFKVAGTDKIEGTRTRRLDFEEFDVPTIINATSGEPLFIKGSAWVDPENGRLWRVQLIVGPKRNALTVRLQLETRLQVDFTHHSTLKMMVPKEMQESFWMPQGRGEGRARYSNFRQFGTSARVIPQR